MFAHGLVSPELFIAVTCKQQTILSAWLSSYIMRRLLHERTNNI